MPPRDRGRLGAAGAHGRGALAPQPRGGRADLLGAAHRQARTAGATEIELHAQLPARDFYEQAGYVAEGDVFEEAGIAHVVMRRPLPPPWP